MASSVLRKLRSIDGVFGAPFLESQAYLLAIALTVALVFRLLTGQFSLTGTLVYTLSCGNVPPLANALAGRFRRRTHPRSKVSYALLQVPISLLAASLGSVLTRWVFHQPLNFLRYWSNDFPFAALITFGFGLISFSFINTRNRMKSENAELADRVALGQQQLQSHESELRAAFDIQSSLLPRVLPQIAGVEISSAWQPARTVSGDFFDVLALSETRIAICLADVSGKGLSAALVTANLQAAFRAFIATEPSPAALCTRLNQALSANLPPGRFVTLAYGVIDTRTRTFTYELAGHNPPVLLRGTHVQHLEGTGPVLGLLPAATFAEQTVLLELGDYLLLTTDGVTEAFSAAEEEFGEDRLIAAARSAMGKSAQAMRSAVMSAVTLYAEGKFHDDASVMAIRFL